MTPMQRHGHALDAALLKQGFEPQLPLVDLHAVGKHPSRHLALWTVFVVGDAPSALSDRTVPWPPRRSGRRV